LPSAITLPYPAGGSELPRPARPKPSVSAWEDDDRSEWEHEKAVAEIARSRASPFGGTASSRSSRCRTPRSPRVLELLVPDPDDRWPKPRPLSSRPGPAFARRRTTVDAASMTPVRAVAPRRSRRPRDRAARGGPLDDRGKVMSAP
jgi:hypothetical protein